MKLLLVCLLSHNATSRVSQKITLWHGMCCVKSFFKLSCILSPIDSVCHDPFKSKITIISNYCCNDPSVTCNISHSCTKGFTCPKQFYSFFCPSGLLRGVEKENETYQNSMVSITYIYM